MPGVDTSFSTERLPLQISMHWSTNWFLDSGTGFMGLSNKMRFQERSQRLVVVAFYPTELPFGSPTRPAASLDRPFPEHDTATRSLRCVFSLRTRSSIG